MNKGSFISAVGHLVFAVLLIAVVAFPQTASHSATLTWTASTTAGVTYNVYYTATSGGVLSKLNTSPVSGTTFTDTVNSAGFWTVTSVDANGDESIKPSEVTIPNAPTALKVVAN